MKFHAEHPESSSIIAHGSGWIQLPQARFESSMVLSSEGLLQPWECSSFDDLTAEHFAQVAQWSKEQGIQVVLFGSGLRNRFPPVQWLRPFVQAQLGLETMDTAAACRTYNVLAGEGRKVLAALILE
ncbi:hypothetical protein E9531_02480 [Lampropedia puyangensis]|uniref:Mth938-like domain-containing protein n=1 Tax=Lampropedia puyangensis TaxID=1330072 RepID=A0A4S8FCV7_9BURK|nr:Mth938-like domain-containing protein [Lampropedia puyangensis]THU05423.1 hypothetical protein E9531_02480 [Lampropedia puyangensis]